MSELTTYQLMCLCASLKDEKEGKYLLEGVREPCNDIWERMPFAEVAKLPIGALCPTCKCLGRIPTKNTWKWLWAASYYGVSARSITRTVDDFKYEFFCDLEGRLTPLAVNAAEAEKWVKENIK